uniref:Transmembrane protein n=1 Tax=Parastrongyloides trichosuri TaxID=131310 RepID=A0A0N4ZDB2_PARTI
MKANLSIQFLILLSILLMLCDVEGWTSCWSSSVSINLELSFFTSKTSSANIFDITVYEEETFWWQHTIYDIYSLATNMTTPTSWTIKTTGPITLWAGFSLYGVVFYKAKRISNGHHVLRVEKMQFSIPDHCLSCTGYPPKCVGSIDLDTKISKINIQK